MNKKKHKWIYDKKKVIPEKFLEAQTVLKTQKKSVVQHSKLNPLLKPAVIRGGKPTVCCLSTAAQLLRHQQGVIAVDLQQVEQEEPISMGIQTHSPHTLLGQRGIRTPCHLTEGLENPVVLLQEKPRLNLE